MATAVALALVAGSAGPAIAAGLGRLTVQSGLGQPLRAEVEVTSLTRDEAASLNARLASPDAFRQAGIEFNPALSSLRFAVDRRPDGRAIIRITSAQPINEPFVDMLVELNWASGKFVREYTFLLDPPELRMARSETVEGGAVQQGAVVPPAAAQAAAPAPAASAPSAPARAEGVPPAPAPKAPRAPAAESPRAAAPAPKAAPAAPAAGGAVNVKSGDTLAAIASRVKPEGVSLDQALIALYQANPSAFFGSVHQLKAGATLSVPEAQSMSAVDAGQARAQLRVHTQDFAAYKARLADAARAVPAAKAGQTAGGSIAAQVDDKGGPATGRDQLKLSKSEAAATATPGSATAPAASKVAAAEQSVARDAALRESQSRVGELEKNVADLQRLLELKNKQLADLQKQVDEAKTAGKAVSGAIAKAEPPTAAAAKPAEPAKVDAARPEPAKPEAAVRAEAPKAEAAPAPTAPAVPAAPAEAPKAAPAAEAPKAEAPVEPPKAPEARPAAPKAAAAPAPEPSLVDDLLSNPLLLPGLGAILALGAGYGWYAMRRRRKVEKFEDSLIAADGFATNSLFGSTGGQSVDTTSTAFAPSAKETGVDVHSTEVDPIAEAEVYIAYGREAQAEEILREALKRNSDRQPIRTKLLEVYANRKDVAMFNALAGEMYDMTGGQNEEWAKVVTMGLALDPDNPLYTGKGPSPSPGAEPPAPVAMAGTAAGAPAGAVVAATAASAAIAGFEKPPAEAPPVRPSGEAPATPSPEVPEAAVDFDLPGVREAGPFAETQPLSGDEASRKALEEDIGALDFDLGLDTTIDKAGERIAASRGGQSAVSELEKALEGKFDLPSLDLPGTSPASAHEKAVLDLDDDLGIDLPALETLSAGGAAKAAAPSSPAHEAPSMDLSAIGLDLEPAAAGAQASSDVTRWQEMATKLDLASAYEEIGDKEGARELLDEVMRGGDNDQQQKARAMLRKIG